MRERRIRFPLLLLGLATVCIAMAAIERLTIGLMPFAASCCHALQVLLPGDVDFWLSSAARGIILAFLLLSTGLVARRVWRIRQFATAVNRVGSAAPTGRLANMCQRLGLEQQVVVLETPVPLAFCFGFLRPRIYASAGLVDRLTDGELQAVLLHEAHHRRRYDPLRTLLVEILATAFFFLPAVGEWRRSFLTAVELAADRHAVRQVGKPALAGALHKLLSPAPATPFAAAGGIPGFSPTEARIAHLLGNRPSVPHVSARGLMTSSMGILLACTVFQLALI